jgi:hypothetical protein
VTYALPADIREVLAPDGSFAGTAAEFTDDQMSQHIQRAQGLVDGSTGVVFTDVNVPPIVKGLVIALGAYYATLAYRKGKDLAQFDPVYLLYQDAQATLKGIRDDEISVIPPSTDTDPVPEEVRSKVINPLLYGATAFTGDDFSLRLKPPCGVDGVSLETDPALMNETW